MGGWSPAGTTGGCWCGTRPSRRRPGELGRHDGQVRAVAVLPDGRVVTGGDDGRVLVWDPAPPGAGPAELGRHDSGVRAVAVLPDGQVVTGGDDERVLVWDPAAPAPARWSWHARHSGGGGGAARRAGSHPYDGRVLVWDPATPSADPAELGAQGSQVGRWQRWPTGGWSPAARRAGAGVGPGHPRRRPSRAEAATTAGCGRWRRCPDGQVVTGGHDGRVLVWDPATPRADPPS